MFSERLSEDEDFLINDNVKLYDQLQAWLNVYTFFVSIWLFCSSVLNIRQLANKWRCMLASSPPRSVLKSGVQALPLLKSEKGFKNGLGPCLTAMTAHSIQVEFYMTKFSVCVSDPKTPYLLPRGAIFNRLCAVYV